ncbi:MAG: hypothetical protein KME45_20655 [Stenomitos rutilans HA7619-LM2]|jgi:hypothetical protein|nr:hypothetical protein [Stenomitos rutilans HA7619-LM2]
MHHWLGIAAAAYAIGAAIEGVHAASQLSHSSLNSTDRTESCTPDATDQPGEQWQTFTAIAAVSLCGACLWPCRLIHRSMKAMQPCRDD